jgi:hypothetical protein
MKCACIWSVLLTLLVACGDTLPRTQVVLVIDAEPGVRSQTHEVQVVIRGGTGAMAQWQERLDRSFIPGGNAEWPMELALVPVGDDASRVYEATATAVATNGDPVAKVRAISGYRKGKTLVLRLLFEDACRDQVAVCGATQTCRAGACVNANVDAMSLEVFKPGVGSDAGGTGGSGGNNDASIDSGTDAADINECLVNNGGCGDATFYSCTNNPGAAPTCADINECLTNNGGCDSLTTCTNNAGAAPTCSACPEGYVGTGATGCAPTLTALTLSSGTLTPVLSSSVMSYTVSVTLATQTITLTPTVPTGATITINSQAVASGSSWTSPTLNLGANAITIVVSQSGHPSRNYTLTVTRGEMSQEAYIKASNTGASDRVGNSVALSSDGGTLAVAAYYEASNATGINGNQADNSATESGAVYVFTRTGSVWSQQAYVKASNTGANDRFGSSVALSSDGGTLAVGACREASNATGINGNQADNSASYAGAVYVFTRSGSVWSQQAFVKASNTGANDQFGSSVALSSDGGTLAVGAPGEDSSATGINGSQSDNSATDSGAVYVFTRAGSVWSQQAYLKASNTGASDRFGSSVAISSDGGTLAVGAYYEDSNATGINGNQADNSATESGAVYVFTRSGSVWSQQAFVKASNTGASDQFGSSVALSDDGGTFAVGAPAEASNATGINGNQADNSAIDSGAVYVFTRSGSVWSQQAFVKASNTGGANEHFGASVALSSDGGTLAVGAHGEDSNATGINGNQADNSASYAGAVYVFTRSGSVWSQQAFVKASNTGAYDSFGVSVALSGDGGTLAVGASREASNATGINGNQADNSASYAGAVYVFR